MFGISDGVYFVVDYGYTPGGLALVHKALAKQPLIIESAYEADKKLQEMTVTFDNYNLKVCKFSKDEEAEFIVRKLRGY